MTKGGGGEEIFRLTFLTAASRTSLGHTWSTVSETTPKGCPRDSRVFNQSRAH